MNNFLDPKNKVEEVEEDDYENDFDDSQIKLPDEKGKYLDIMINILASVLSENYINDNISQNGNKSKYFVFKPSLNMSLFRIWRVL